MADEYFFALTLEGAKASEVWDPESKGTEEYQGGHKLIIKQALLGPEAVDGELNVIQVEAMTWKESIKIPVATLKAGGANSQVLLDLSFPDPPVTFSLIQGSGPVHIIGHHLIGGPVEEFDEMDELEEEMLDDEEGEEGVEEDEEEDEGPKSKKSKTTNNTKGKGAVTKNNKGKK
ncbi:PREDICTED: nucleoplasmin-like protein isoform X2 [Nicrophorus vespilloides]|uniref:Nucleoplasmin-like protein isoform X2 n=1 Tax=Nicrophorus vespilloides TaxID=110193 RepID=A0ABM1MAJ6_NICVS|nr:PREDICTED: nucleoplasmin-like protein isoform X2 [Nicrophorus vespilloides]